MLQRAAQQFCVMSRSPLTHSTQPRLIITFVLICQNATGRLYGKVTVITAIKINRKRNTHPFNCPFSGNTQVSQYQKGKTNLDFTEARDSEWQWHQLGHMQVCTLLQTDNHASTSPLSFL